MSIQYTYLCISDSVNWYILLTHTSSDYCQHTIILRSSQSSQGFIRSLECSCNIDLYWSNTLGQFSHDLLCIHCIVRLVSWGIVYHMFTNRPTTFV